MSVLNLERPDFLKDEEMVLFENSVAKFFDAHAASGSPVAKEAIERIGEIYAIEEALRATSL